MKKSRLIFLTALFALIFSLLPGFAGATVMVQDAAAPSFLPQNVVITDLKPDAVTAEATQADDLDRAKLLIRTFFYFPYDAKVLEMTDIRAMLNALNDPYSQYYDKTEYKNLLDSLKSELIGLGIQYAIKDDKIVILNVYEGSPAAEWLLPSDIITKVNGIDVNAANAAKFKELIAPELDKEVVITVLRGDKTLEAKIKMAKVTIPSIESKMLNKTIGYIKIAEFKEDTDKEVSNALNVLLASNMQGLVLDLRNCPGGIAEVSSRVCANFIPNGPVAYMREKNGSVTMLYAADQYRKIPLVVLVNGNSASASELVTGAIQDAKTGLIMGEKTFGKGIIQYIFTLPSGAGIKITSAKYYTRENREIHKIGIIPDVIVKDPNQQLQAAIKVLEQRGTGIVSVKSGSKTMYRSETAVNLANAPFTLNNALYVPIKPVAEALGMKVSVQNGKVYVTSTTAYIAVNPATKKVIKNGFIFDINAVMKNGQLFVPAKGFSQYLDCLVEWQSSSGFVNIKIK